MRSLPAPITRILRRSISTTLTDTFNRQHTYLRISLTEKCNLRCTYCMPPEGVPLTPSTHLLTTPEILRLARLFVLQNVTKIRLTGGEPTVRKDLLEIVAGLNDLRPLGLKDICITTNGIALKRKLEDLRGNGLDHINVSLDTLDPLKFDSRSRHNLNFKSLKLNAVIIRNVNDLEIPDFIDKFTRDHPIYVRFIEYMPFDGNKWNDHKFLAYRDMLRRIEEKLEWVEKVGDDANDTSKAYRIPGYKGKFGFITSMSDHFCGTCNRLRILANGGLKVCLFGNTEGLTDEGIDPFNIRCRLTGLVKRKKKQHAGMENLVNMPNKPMILIGKARGMENWANMPDKPMILIGS
ncbi:hypothetical protein BC829DRAFT_425257 [Chytridium lagenaria]|nr:hypothetical protein BC829DRAFT_425257 [Chytridium lagenaria]